MAAAAGGDSAPGRGAEQEVSPEELAKWREMIDQGLPEYIQAHPDRFRRRARRGVPPPFRWRVWKAAVGLEDAKVRPGALPANYDVLSHKAHRWTELIRIDVCRTFPELKSAFDLEQQQRLQRLLNAYAGHRPEVGYCQGMNFVAGLLLLVSDNEEESFGVFTCLMDTKGLAGFYRDKLPLLRRYLQACDVLVKETVPDLREHFIKENVQPAVYLHEWFLTLFINCFPLSMVKIIWDTIVVEGLPVILKIAVSTLQVLKDSLLAMHFEDIIKFFKMMKTYDDDDGELNAVRIGQLLVKHTEHISIPDKVLDYINGDPQAEKDGIDADGELWESADHESGGLWQSFSRFFGSSSPSSK